MAGRMQYNVAVLQRALPKWLAIVRCGYFTFLLICAIMTQTGAAAYYNAATVTRIVAAYWSPLALIAFGISLQAAMTSNKTVDTAAIGTAALPHSGQVYVQEEQGTADLESAHALGAGGAEAQASAPPPAADGVVTDTTALTDKAPGCSRCCTCRQCWQGVLDSKLNLKKVDYALVTVCTCWLGAEDLTQSMDDSDFDAQRRSGLR